MAMSFTDLNNLNLNTLRDVISLTIGFSGELQRGLTTLAGVDNKTPIVTFKANDKAIRKSQGCDGTYEYSDISDNVKYYDFQALELPIVVCLQDLWGKMVAKGLHLSDDFGESELAGFLGSEVLKVLEADLLRLAWLSGTKTGDVAYDIFKNGGFLKQMQDSTETILPFTLDNASVETTLKALIDTQAPDKKESSEFFITSNVFRILKNLLEAKDNTTAQMILEDGRPQFYFEGYKINELTHVAASMLADKTDQDAFIAFTPKDNIQLALEDASVNIKPFVQDAKSRKYYSTTVFAADAVVAVPQWMKLATKAKA